VSKSERLIKLSARGAQKVALFLPHWRAIAISRDVMLIFRGRSELKRLYLRRRSKSKSAPPQLIYRPIDPPPTPTAENKAKSHKRTC
jgi:hypothetical protein